MLQLTVPLRAGAEPEPALRATRRWLRALRAGAAQLPLHLSAEPLLVTQAVWRAVAASGEPARTLVSGRTI